MIDKICTFLTNRIRKEMPEIDDERAEVINYGLQNIVGEIPKVFIMLAVAYVFNIFWLSLFTFLALFLYKGASGGVHLKTHIGCILFTTGFYCLIPFVSQYFIIPQTLKFIIIPIIWVFGMIMIKLYAPADTENVPILRKKERAKKKIISYIIVTAMIIISFLVKDRVISNMFRVGVLLQSLMISKLTYSIFKVKFGYLEYIKTQKNAI